MPVAIYSQELRKLPQTSVLEVESKYLNKFVNNRLNNSIMSVPSLPWMSLSPLSCLTCLWYFSTNLPKFKVSMVLIGCKQK